MRKGFTLIELLIVIGIIGILTGVSAFSLSILRDRGRDAERISELPLIQEALQSYFIDQGFYPRCVSGDSIPAYSPNVPRCLILDSHGIELTNRIGNPNCYPGPTCPERVYLSADRMPHDPREAGNQHYCYQSFASVQDSLDRITACDNIITMCYYYDISIRLGNPPPGSTNSNCNDGTNNHTVNYFLRPL